MNLPRLLLLLCALGILDARAADNPKADNTQKNERDRDGKTVTPPDQSNQPEDLKLTQSIRKQVMKDKGLSMMAKNVKIISAGGVVTLRGPVTTDAERLTLEKIAKSSAGENKVVNELEVKK